MGALFSLCMAGMPSLAAHAAAIAFEYICDVTDNNDLLKKKFGEDKAIRKWKWDNQKLVEVCEITGNYRLYIEEVDGDLTPVAPGAKNPFATTLRKEIPNFEHTRKQVLLQQTQQQINSKIHY